MIEVGAARGGVGGGGGAGGGGLTAPKWHCGAVGPKIYARKSRNGHEMAPIACILFLSSMLLCLFVCAHACVCVCGCVCALVCGFLWVRARRMGGSSCLCAPLQNNKFIGLGQRRDLEVMTRGSLFGTQQHDTRGGVLRITNAAPQGQDYVPLGAARGGGGGVARECKLHNCAIYVVESKPAFIDTN